MTAATYISLLKDPAALHDWDRAKLAALVDKHPYDQALQALYLKKLQLDDQEAYVSHLPLTAILSHDRKKLQQWSQLTLHKPTQTESLHTHVEEVLDEVVEEVADPIETEEVEEALHLDEVAEQIEVEQEVAPEPEVEVTQPEEEPTAEEISTQPEEEVVTEPEPEVEELIEALEMEVEQNVAERETETEPEQEDETETEPEHSTGPEVDVQADTQTEAEEGPETGEVGAASFGFPIIPVSHVDMAQEVNEAEQVEGTHEKGAEPGKMSFSAWLQYVQEGKTPPAEPKKEPKKRKKPADELDKLIYSGGYEAALMKESNKVAEEPEKKPVAEAKPADTPPVEEESEVIDQLAKKSLSIDDEVVTETLAKIFVIQKKYSKALDAYEKLIVKFPEREAHFRQQIENIRNK